MKNLRGLLRFDASARLHKTILEGVDDPGAKALLAFFDNRTPGSTRYEGADTSPLDDSNAFVVFALAGESIFLHERPAIRAAWSRYRAAQSAERETVQCLVTGEMAPLARLHGNVSGFGMNKPTLVGFNQPAFEFFGKSQGENAPVGEQAAFEYVTALNMLCTDRRHYINLAGDKVVFWAERDAQLEEDAVFAVLGGTVEREDLEGTLDADQRERVRGVLECYVRGGDPATYPIDPNVPFYVLGLATNRTRLVVRFFYASTFGHLMENLAAHYRDIAVVDMRYRFPPPRRLLIEVALKDGTGLARMDSVPPTIESALMRAILEKTGYPAALYAAVLERVRAEGAVTPLRAGLIKGYLIRNEEEEGVGMGLDPNEREPAYLMGRLFALYEKAQAEAIENLNASITDKYWSAAMATPQTVFPQLVALNRAHISKTHNYYLSGKIVDVFDLLEMQTFGSEAAKVRAGAPSGGVRDDPAKYVFPPTMNANAQGKFIMGYYHQNKDLYTKKPDDKKPAAKKEAAIMLNNRYDFVLFFEVVNGNPNGDPDAGNMPRIDMQTGHGIVTDVCIKRKVRNYVEFSMQGQKGYDIFVTEGAALNSKMKLVYDDFGLNKDTKDVRDMARGYMCARYFDVRAFGAVMDTGDHKCGQVRGPVQLCFGRSIDPILQQEITITRMAATNENEDPTKNRTMGRKYAVPYGLYRMEGFISPAYAEKTGFTEKTSKLFWKALVNMFEVDHSAARGRMASRRLIAFKHDTALGAAPSYALFEGVKVRAKFDDRLPREFGDYEITVAEPPAGVTMLELI